MGQPQALGEKTAPVCQRGGCSTSESGGALAGLRLPMQLNAMCARSPASVVQRPSLIQAARAGDDDAVGVLLATVPEQINQRADKGTTPLILASLNGHLGTARRLLAAGVDVNLSDEAGFTALLAACQSGHSDVVRCLLAQPGIGVSHAERSGSTALHLACYYGHTEIVRALVAWRAPPSDGAAAAAAVDINCTNREGFTPLIAACQTGRLPAVECLLAAPDIDVNLASTNGQSALIAAAHYGHYEIVERLLAKPAIRIGSALDAAVEACGESHPIAELLRARAPPKPRCEEVELAFGAAIVNVDTGEAVEAVHDPQRLRAPPTMPLSWAAAAALAPRDRLERGAEPSCRECDASIQGVRAAEARACAAEQRAAAAEAVAASARGDADTAGARALDLESALARQRGDQAVICKLDDEALRALEKEQRAALDRVVEESLARRSAARLCVVCHERPRERAPPCGHCCVCGQCSIHSSVANVCPVCRAAVPDGSWRPVFL